MELTKFIENFAGEFDHTDASVFTADTVYHNLDEWSSLIAMCIASMVEDEYDVVLKGDDIRNARTIGDLFNTVKAKM